MGSIVWQGENDAEENIYYGQIRVEALEVDDTDEAGRMKLQVAESNGTSVGITTGLLIEGSDNTTDGEVNVTIAAGAASITTIAGTPKYMPKLSAITEIPSPRTSDSEFAFSISDKLEIIGVIASFTASLNIGCSLSMSAIVGLKE